jgi:hypothetical protein
VEGVEDFAGDVALEASHLRALKTVAAVADLLAWGAGEISQNVPGGIQRERPLAPASLANDFAGRAGALGVD